MENKAYHTIQKYQMLSFNDTVIVGLSGGADSCALLHFLVSLRKEWHFNIAACHVNHHLRGGEADRDEHFAEEICQKYGVKLYILHADVKEESKRQKKSTEQCGREIRYAFFEKIAQELSGKIATAHTASDNAETVLFNLTRGSGAAGLCGIPPVRGNVIRPLIECTRTEIEDYCDKNNLPYVTDSTNLTCDYTRNKIRLEIIPKLKEINPSLENTISGMTERMKETVDFISQCAEEALRSAETDKGYRITDLQKLNEAVLSQAIQILCKKNFVLPEAKHIALIKKLVYDNGAVEIKNQIFAVSKQGFLRIVHADNRDFSESIAWNGEKSLLIHNKKICLSKINIDEFHKRKKFDKMLFHNSFDYDTIPVSLVFRTRRAGDRFCLPKRCITKSVKRLFNEWKIPQEQRDRLLLLANGSEILWIEGIGTAQPYSVRSDTSTVLVINTQATLN